MIVTGARILADDPAAVAWARDILSRELASATLVVAGDARGPDAWAHEIALARLTPRCQRWCVNGYVIEAGDHEWHRVSVWSGEGDERLSHREICLARNKAMVQHYTGCKNARVVALLSPDARTQGTAHTVGLARAAGIDVSEWTWGGER